MVDTLKQYFGAFFNDIPLGFLLLVILALLLCCFIVLLLYDYKRSIKIIANLITLGYYAILIASTVIYRSSQHICHYDFTPFWSYMAIQKGQDELVAENMMNVLVFLPIGILIGVSINNKWLRVLGVGVILSLLIEMLQLIFKRGFAELDDVFHNIVGCLVGYGITQLAFLLFKNVYNKQHKVR